MECSSKLDWHLAHVRLMLCGVLLGSSVGHVLHSFLGANLPIAQAVSSCVCIAMAHWAAGKNPYRGENWL